MKHETRLNRIMVIDDSSIDRWVAEQTLTECLDSVRVILIDSAEQALEYLKVNQDSPEKLPEMILLDIRMPEMDGFEFLNEYEKLPVSLHESCKVIMLSSTRDLTDYQRVNISPLVDGFVLKPLVCDSLQYFS